MSEQTFVVVGANSAGGTAAATLRTEGFDGRIVLVGAEPHLPYERPPLSKEYLRGEVPRDRAFLRPKGWWEENGVEVLLATTATRVDVEAKTVHLDTGDAVAFDKALIATGGRNRRLSVPGVELEGVHSLRTFEDADALREEARSGRHAVVIGSGFIGCEVSASLRQLGVEVDVVDPGKAPLLRVLGPEIAAVYDAIHRDHGVRFHFEERVAALRGSNGRVEAVQTQSGLELGCDFVVVGVGIRPVTDAVDGSGLDLTNGVAVDATLRTSNPDVYAAGDVANHDHPLFGRRMRVEHWDNALRMGVAAAQSMLGTGGAFEHPHWFWSDQYDTNLQYVGFATEWDELVIRGSLRGRRFVAFYVKDGLVRGVAGMDRGRDVRRAMGIVAAARPVDPVALRDEDVDLKQLAASLTAASS